MKTPDFIEIEASGWGDPLEFKQGAILHICFGAQRSRFQTYHIEGLSHSGKKLRMIKIRKGAPVKETLGRAP